MKTKSLIRDFVADNRTSDRLYNRVSFCVLSLCLEKKPLSHMQIDENGRNVYVRFEFKIFMQNQILTLQKYPRGLLTSDETLFIR